MAPALIEAAGVASRERQSTSCNKTQPVCLAGKRLFDLKQQKYLVREAKISTRTTLLTSLQPRVVLSTDGVHTSGAYRQNSIDRSTLQEESQQSKGLCTVRGTGGINISRRGVYFERSAMNYSDNGHTSPAVDDDSGCNSKIMRDSPPNSTESERKNVITEQHGEAVDKKSLSNLKRRKSRHHEKLKDLEQRIDLLSKRVRTIQCQRLASHVVEQLRYLDDRNGKRDSLADKKETSPSYHGAERGPGRQNSKHSGPNDPSEQNVSGDIARKEESGETTTQMLDECLQVLLHRSKVGESFMDPDATESETEDDEICDQIKPKQRRTDSVWWKDRALIGSRGSWLESKISDIDQKLKKYEDILRLLYSKRTSLFETSRKNPESMEGKDTENGAAVTESSSLRSIDPVRRNGILKSFVSTQPVKNTELNLPEDSCSRTLAVKYFHPHRYLRCGDVKVEKTNYLGYICPLLPAVDACSVCQKPKLIESKMVSGNSRAAALDHSYHAKLSFKNDILLPAHLEAAIRDGGLDTKIKPMGSKMVARKREQEKKRGTNRSALNSLVSAAKASKIKLSGHGLSQSLPAKLHGKSATESTKKRCAALNAANQIEKKASKLTVPRESTTRSISTSSESANLSHSQSASNLSQLVRKKRPSSAFDINNIVIPYSIACATRVEKLKYKEIPTPGWRSLDPVPDAKVQRMDPELREDDDDAEQPEETSDDAYALRHVVCELEERKRFSAFFQPLRRLRSTRRSSECNTPEPHSPASNDEGRPAVSSATTPTDSGHSWVVSGKSEGRNLLWTQLKPEENAVPPWPKRLFPLTEEEIADLEASSTQSVDSGDELRSQREPSGELNSGSSSSKQQSPCSVQSSSPVPPEDDVAGSDVEYFRSLENEMTEQDDENWTVKLVSSEKSTEQTGKNRKGIVLKLAKK